MKMNIMRNLLFLGFAVILLTSCSTTSHQVLEGASDNETKQANWKARQRLLTARSNWQLKGRASVTYRGENWPFGLEWQQQSPSHYTMHIKHPLTQNELANIVKTPHAVSLSINGKVYRDSNAEQLIEKHLRVKLPVSGMQYWVLGTRSPHSPVNRVKLDRMGRPVLLQQSGWTIEYSAYQNARRDALPLAIKISRSSPQAVQVKTRVRQWK